MMQEKPGIAAIVAAHNEEETIAGVVETLVKSGYFSDVVVVSDGSTDQTESRAKKAGATLVHQFPWKHGKGKALLHGVASTDTPYLFLCDADLIDFDPSHIKALLDPVLSGNLDMCVGLRDRGKSMMKLARHLPLIGGERALKRSIFEMVPDKFLNGYMIEGALNYYCRSRKRPYGAAEMPGVKIRRKMQKVGVLQGFLGYIKMIYQIIIGMIIVRVAKLRGKF